MARISFLIAHGRVGIILDYNHDIGTDTEEEIIIFPRRVAPDNPF